MTRKDYVAIAEAFRDVTYDPDLTRSLQDLGLLSVVAGKVAHIMQLDNPRFDRERFLEACGF